MLVRGADIKSQIFPFYRGPWEANLINQEPIKHDQLTSYHEIASFIMLNVYNAMRSKLRCNI